MQKKMGLFGFIISIILLMSFVSAGFFDWFDGITGKATSQPFNLTITIGNNAPQITVVSGNGSFIVSEASARAIILNVTIFDADGATNLNDTNVSINFTRSGEPTRTNSSCAKLGSFSSNYTNYTCTVYLWYFDQAGDWNIGVGASDINGAYAVNSTQTINYQSLTALVSHPGSLSFSGVSPGSVNKTATTALTLNNTGNAPIGTNLTQINATSLRGETNPTYALWAGNFSLGINGTDPAPCAASSSNSMNQSVFTNITGASLPRGNNSINTGNESSGQEQFFACLRYAGPELTAQTYSTVNESAWTVKIQ